jgi:hypothetical protein
MSNSVTREQHNKWCREYKQQPHINVGNRLRSRILEAIKAQKSKKANKTDKLTGCTILYLIRHLNGGKENILITDPCVHIDHIIPISFFDLTIKEEQYICFNWRNLQLLTAHDNLTKSSSVPDNVKELYLSLKKKVLYDLSKGVIYE